MDKFNIGLQILVSLTILLPIMFTIIAVLRKKWKRISEILNKIDIELKPNHGTSFYDRIRRIEKILILSDQRTKLLFSVYEDGLYECNEDGSCVWVNKKIKEIFGLDEHEMLGNGWLISIIPEHRNKVYEHWKYCVSNKIPYENKYIIYNKHDKLFYKIETYASANVDNEGKIIGYFGVIKIQDSNEQNIFTV